MREFLFSLLFIASSLSAGVANAQSIQNQAIWNQIKNDIHDIQSFEQFSLKTNTVDNSISPEQRTLLAKYMYGVMSFDRSDYEEAKKYLQESLAAKELNVYAFFYLGRIAKAQDKTVGAMNYFNKALALHPHYDLKRRIQLEMAKTSIATKNYTAARQQLLLVQNLFRRTENYPEVIWHLLIVDQKLAKPSVCSWFKTMFRSYPTYNSETTSWTLNEKSWKLTSDLKKPVTLGCQIRSGDRRAHMDQLIALGQYNKISQELADTELKIHELELLDLRTEFELRAGDPKKSYADLKVYYDKYQNNDDFLQLYGKAAARSLNHTEALKSYDDRVALARTASEKAQIIFRKGFLEYELGMYKEAYASFKKVPETFPKTIYQGDVYWYLAWTAYLQKDYDLAIGHFEEMLSLIEKRYRFRSRDNYSKDRVKYWLAQAHKLKGNDLIANAHFREIVGQNKLNYYSFLSAAFLNQSQVQKKMGKKQKQPDITDPLLENLRVPWAYSVKEGQDKKDAVAPASVVDVDTQLNSQGLETAIMQITEDKVISDSRTIQSEYKDLLKVFAMGGPKFSPYVSRFKVLNHLGLSNDAKWELYELEKKSRTKGQKKALASLYMQVDDLHRASRILTLDFEKERLNPSLVDDDPFALWSSTFPQPHKDAVSASSSLFSVPEHLVYSIMRAESFYSHQAMSGAGARGLLQLMPFTANRVADLLGKPEGVTPDELFEPYINIQLGVRYLKRLLKAFEGDQVLAIAAYNAGPHRAEWWVSRFGKLRQDEFIEHILFLETRNYVKKVMHYQWIYDLLYNKPISLAEIKKPLGFQLTRVPSLTEQWDSTE